jgi:hypothetical protein
MSMFGVDNAEDVFVDASDCEHDPEHCFDDTMDASDCKHDPEHCFDDTNDSILTMEKRLSKEAESDAKIKQLEEQLQIERLNFEKLRRDCPPVTHEVAHQTVTDTKKKFEHPDQKAVNPRNGDFAGRNRLGGGARGQL